jgi:glycosyltransferase involved in cell wall biosynthesis
VDVLVLTVVHTPLDARIHTRQIRALLEAGHRVRLAAPFTGYGIDPSDVHREGLSVADIPRATGRRRLRSLRVARTLLASASEDVVILHDPELLLGLIGLATPPVIWDVHEDLAGSLADKSWLPAWSRGLVRNVVTRLERSAERHVHLMLAEEGYRTRFRRPHPVVGNRPWLRPQPVTLGSDRVVYLGRVSELRGGRDLLEVGRVLAADGVRMHVIGPIDAALQPDFGAAVEAGHVQADGFVPNEQALGLLDGALAGLSLLHDHPNYRHSLPTKVLEYQAAGLPVITTPLPEAERIVRSASSGVVVPFADPGAVRDAVLRLRDDLDGARAMGAAGRNAAIAEWSWDAVAGDFVAYVERVARGQRRQS